MNRKNSKAAQFGAGIAFVAFMLTGAVPALVYGGYMGLMLSSVLVGSAQPVDTHLLWSRMLTGGGMVLGCVATLLLYVIVGAFMGLVAAKVGHAVARRLGWDSHAEGRVGDER